MQRCRRLRILEDVSPFILKASSVLKDQIGWKLKLLQVLPLSIVSTWWRDFWPPSFQQRFFINKWKKEEIHFKTHCGGWGRRGNRRAGRVVKWYELYCIYTQIGSEHSISLSPKRLSMNTTYPVVIKKKCSPLAWPLQKCKYLSDFQMFEFVIIFCYYKFEI